jgi:hypothetical protein
MSPILTRWREWWCALTESSGSQVTPRRRAESTANSSLENVQVGGQAIEPPNRGEGAKKKRRINPRHQLSPPEK